MGEQTQPLLLNRRSCELSKDQRDALVFLSVFIIIMIGLVALIAWDDHPPKSPSFKVESVSVLFHKSNNDDGTRRAEWNIRLSVKSGGDYYEFDYDELHVLFRLATSSNWSRTGLFHSSSYQDPKNMTSLIAIVETLMPRSFDLIGSPPLEFEVMFVLQAVDVPRIKAFCSHMMLRISPDAKEGIMDSAPRFCPYQLSKTPVF